MASTKQNTPGLGIEYEVHLPAYFALLLNTNPEIEDFKLRSNVKEFGNLDDLLVDVKTKEGENLHFAFQLKHKEKSSKNLLPTNFEAKGDFNLEKYCEAFKKLNEENRKKYHFILYTNKNFDSSRTNEVQKFDMEQDESCLGRNFFDTSGDGKHLYKFEVNGETGDGKKVTKEDFREFFSKFSLYTGQANIRDLDKSHILKILKFEECYVKYVDFFRRWHRGDFIDKILDKKTLNVHLVDILLSSVAINYHLSDDQDGNSIFFEILVQQFDITIIDASKKEFIKQLEKNIDKYPEEFTKNSEEEIIKMCKKSKLIDRFTKELKEETKLKLLHYFFQKPLFLDFQESSKNLISEAIKLCRIQENEIKVVIVGRDIDLSKFSHLKIFTNLTEVDEKFLEETKKRCNLSLQGRNISFEAIYEDEIREFVTPRALFQMLKGSFSIGKDKEKLPEFYIPRTVSTTVFDIESIIKHSSGSTAIIFYCEEIFEKLKTLIQDIVDRHDYLYEDFLDGIILKTKEPSNNHLYQNVSRDTFPEIPPIILRKEGCSRNQLDEISKKIGKDDIRLFKVIDEKMCLLVMSFKDTYHKEKYESTKMFVQENNIDVFFNNSLNILCAQPGMGKSILMKYLKNQYDPNFYTLMVDLKAHNQFFKKRNCEIEEVLKYFLELEKSPKQLSEYIRTQFLRKKKIVLFLDGLDEVEHKCVDRVLEISKLLSELGFRIWLSSRQNLKQTIEQYFNIFVIEINELNKNQQENYIENRLASLYNKNEIEEIVDLIFSNTDLVNNRKVLEIPLQLHIITQIFIDDKSYYFNINKNNFILTKMFEIFFEGKYQHFLAKFESKNAHLLGGLEETLENYEIVALHSVLDDKHFQKLQIEKSTVVHIKKSDFLGIITEINSANKAVFEHLTFAEYFASKFLVKNFDKARIVKEEMFTEKYQNLFLIFNIMLVEDSPLHLSIIYKDLSRIQEMDDSSVVDKGGRNFLQAAACVATRHLPLESNRESSTSECLVKDFPVRHFKGEDSTMKEIINLALSNCDPFKNDKIFEWNSMDYALTTGALYIVEAILKIFEKPINFCEILGNYYSDEVIAYYSIRFGYHRLLSEILAKKCCHVTGIRSTLLYSNSFRPNNSVLHFIFFTSECTNRIKIVELLTGDDINKIVYKEDGYTFLHFAVFHGDTEFVKFLLEKEADPNVKDKKGKSSLFLAVEQNNFEISKLLIEKEANVNIVDLYGLSSPLLLAVKRNNLEISKLLVEKGADVNIEDQSGTPTLYWAAKQNNFDISKLLIEQGADVNFKDKNGWSALFCAVERNNLEILKFLVEKGADVTVKAEYGTSPLHWAAERNSLEISKFLVEKGADINIKDKNDWSALFCSVERDNLEISKLLVERGADINIKDKNGKSPLFLAVEQNNLEISKMLIEKRADVNIQDNKGKSPLFLAVEQNNLKISKLLIEKGADINIEDQCGTSPLYWAVEQNNLEISKLLIDKGADINIEDQYGTSPLYWAIEHNNLEITKLLVENGADITVKSEYGTSPLYWAAEQNNLDITKFLVEKGADVNIQDKVGRSPLFCSLERDNTELSKLLVERGADVNIKDDYGRTPLFVAVQLNNLEISKLLIEKGANINIEDQYDTSPLYWAAEQDNLEISKLLIEKGADVNIQDKDGWSPLLWSASQSNFEISKLLVEKGADINIQDKDRWSPLLWAAIQSNLEISKLLVERGADVNIKDDYGRSPLFLAVERNNLEISKLLLEGGAEVNYEIKRSKTPLSSVIKSIKLLIGKEANHNESKKISTVLCLAAKKGNFSLVKILIENGAVWDAGIILDAIEGGNIQIIDLFLAKGVDLSKVNALHKAVWSVVRGNNIDVVNYLIENGADVNLKNDDGFTILHEATFWEHLGTVEFLLNNLKTAHLLLVPDKEGRTCLHNAVYSGHVEVVELLLKAVTDLNKIDIRNNKYPLHFATKDGCLQKELLIEMTRVVRDRHLTSDQVSKYFMKYPIISN